MGYDWLIRGTLLADSDVFQGMASGFRGRRAQVDTTDVFIWFGIAVGVALSLWGLAKLLSRQERARRHYSPTQLFRALCNAHDLDRRTRNLLREVALLGRLEHPARVFVEIEYLESALARPEFAPRVERLQALRDQLFGATDAEQPAAAPNDAAFELLPVEAAT